MSIIILNEVASPTTPSAGKVKLFANSGSMYVKNDAGVETMLGGSGYSSPYQSDTILKVANFPTWINQVSATAVDVASSGILLSYPYDAANEVHTCYKDLDYTIDYTLTFRVIPTSWCQYNRIGITLMYSGEADPTHCVYFGFMQRDDHLIIAVHKYNTHTSFDGVYYEQQMRPPAIGPTWFQLQDDGTDWIWRTSVDGTNFVTIGTTTRNDYFSGDADRVGLSIVPEFQSFAAPIELLGWYTSFLETTP